MSVNIKSKKLLLNDLPAWFKSRETANQFQVKQIPFSEMQGWYLEEGTGNIVHQSGKFFKIEGLRVRSKFREERAWDQPIINQPEIGILGIITRKIGQVRYFLMQAKMEPGNVNILQMSPTVQATKSNYTQVHKGKLPPFLDYFFDRTKARILVDQLQSEQGARFLRKRNRNMIIEVDHEIEPPDDFCWLTMNQIRQLFQVDNIMNMDARSVLSGIRLIGDCITDNLLMGSDAGRGPFAREVLMSMSGKSGNLHSRIEIISWFTNLKTKYECAVETIPLNQVGGWTFSDHEIFYPSRKYFSVVAVSVRAGSREVFSWDQPLIKQAGLGLIGFLAKRINNVLHFLVQAKVEPGFIDTIEMLPTVCFSDVDSRLREHNPPPFADRFINSSADMVRYCRILSEEGGRFYHSQNQYMVIEMDTEEPIDIPENYIWMTLSQLMEFSQYNNYLSIEIRSLMSCLSFV